MTRLWDGSPITTVGDDGEDVLGDEVIFWAGHRFFGVASE